MHTDQEWLHAGPQAPPASNCEEEAPSPSEADDLHPGEGATGVGAESALQHLKAWEKRRASNRVGTNEHPK